MAEPKEVRLEEAIVARGRSLDIPNPQKKFIAGYTQEGKVIEAFEVFHHREGARVKVPVDEVAGLRASGYLFDPDAVPMAPAEGPRFTEHDSK
jgi:hypothetical protein